MSSLYQEIVRDIEDEGVKREVIQSLIFFESKITPDLIPSLREKVNEAFKYRNVPRKLSEEQIENILEYAIPKIPAVINVISDDNNRQIKEFLREELRERKIVNDEDVLERLKIEIREKYYRSIVSPGDSVGVEVAMSFGQPLTQMNLDLFHSAGTSSELGSGVKSIQELLNVSDKRKKNLTTIHFKDKDLTREEIHLRGRSLKGVNIRSLLEYDPEIIYVNGHEDIDKMGDSWWYDNFFTLFNDNKEVDYELHSATYKVDERFDIDSLEEYHNHDTVKEHAYINNDGNLVVVYDSQKQVPVIDNAMFISSRNYIPMDVFMRLRLNVTKCYNLGIEINDLMLALKDDSFDCVTSPLSVGIIDIHPNPTFITEGLAKFMSSKKTTFASCKQRNLVGMKLSGEEEDLDSLKILFLTSVVESCLSEIFVSGIKGIENIIPITENVINLIKTKRVLDIDVLVKYNKKSLWYVSMNYMKLKYNGIPYQKLINLCRISNLDIIEDNIFDADGSYSRHPHLIVEARENPKDVISRNFNIADKSVKEQVKRISEDPNETEYSLPEFPEIYRSAFYNYAYAEGEKIVRKLMRHTKLDNRLILPNNPNEIYEIFGIEAARLYMVREYVHLIETSDSYITPVNIELLVDYQTGMGFLTPIHAIGASKQGTSTLSAATFQDPVGAFQKAATVGKVDKINSISACIVAGKRSLNGTGLSDVSFDIDSNVEVDEEARNFSSHEEFCQQKYIVNQNDNDKEEVTINIEKMVQKEKKEESKFSSENVPTIVPAMTAPDFLIDDVVEEQPEEPELEESLAKLAISEPTPAPVQEEEDDDFEIPEAPEETISLADF